MVDRATALSEGEDCEGPDLIYLPEVTFDLKKFGEKVKKLLETKHPSLWRCQKGSAPRKNLCVRAWKQH